MKKISTVLRLAVLLLASGFVSIRAQTPATSDPANALIEADLNFARLAATVGVEKAFDAYLLVDSVHPLADLPKPSGKGEVLTRMKKLDQRGLMLTWKPIKAEIAASGDLGYTFGTWEIHDLKAEVKDGAELAHGYYSTIWRKQKDNAWKVIFDMGNEAPSDKG